MSVMEAISVKSSFHLAQYLMGTLKQPQREGQKGDFALLASKALNDKNQPITKGF